MKFSILVSIGFALAVSFIPSRAQEVETGTSPAEFFEEFKRCVQGFNNDPAFGARLGQFSKPVEVPKVVDRFEAAKRIYQAFPLIAARLKIELESHKGVAENRVSLYQVTCSRVNLLI